MSFKVTITNNKNGEVIVNEENAVAIIGAVAVKPDIARNGFTDRIGYIHCNTLYLANAILAAETVISEIKNEVPAVDVLLQLKAMEDKTKANNNDKIKELKMNKKTKQEQIEEARKETAKDILSDLLDLHNMVQDINQKTDFYYSIEQLIAEIEIKYDIEVEG